MTTDEKMGCKLDGKIALVTGGTSGIGLATARRFVAEGAYVFITGRREKELASAVESIGESVTGVQGDVSQIGDIERLFAQIKQEKGLSILCLPTRVPQNMRPSEKSPRSSLTRYSTSM
jgi:NAD(P)-dependent dehydrogenase (short-subunit alcohol dehydrogenase family)